MFSDPTSVALGATVSSTGGTATSFPRIRTDGYSSEYQSADSVYKMKVTHTRGARIRSEMRIDIVGTYTNPATGLAEEVTSAVYLVINRPLAGFTTTQIKSVLNGLLAYYAPSATQDKILALES